MTIWPVLTLVLAVAAAGFAAAWWRQRQKRREAEADAERRLDRLRREHTDRVRRLEDEVERAETTGHLELAEDLLAVADALDRAVPEEHADDGPDESSKRGDALDASVADGVVMARGEFRRTLEDHGIERISPDRGAEFDPTHHEAIRAVDETPVDANCVVTCHRAGYVFDDRLLRAATVEVAVGADEPASSTNGEGEPEIGDDAEERGAETADEAVDSDGVEATREANRRENASAESAEHPEPEPEEEPV